MHLFHLIPYMDGLCVDMASTSVGGSFRSTMAMYPTWLPLKKATNTNTVTLNYLTSAMTEERTQTQTHQNTHACMVTLSEHPPYLFHQLFPSQALSKAHLVCAPVVCRVQPRKDHPCAIFVPGIRPAFFHGREARHLLTFWPSGTHEIDDRCA